MESTLLLLFSVEVDTDVVSVIPILGELSLFAPLLDIMLLYLFAATIPSRAQTAVYFEGDAEDAGLDSP